MKNFNIGYTNWKKWKVFFEIDAEMAAYYEGEFLDTPMNCKRVFEMGFGAGQFLAWARNEGAFVVGSELIPELVETGIKKNYDVRLGDARHIFNSSNEGFDLIVCLDVLEHIPEDQLLPLLNFLASILKPDGKLVARFPNGQSPFGSAWQHGDITHLNVLSKNKMQQLAEIIGLKVQRCGNAFRVISPGLQGLKDRIQYALRDLIQIFLCKVYALGNLPMDPNVVVVLRKQ